MPSDTPEPLWREVVGETEPWRRGRLFLVLLAIWTFLMQCLAIGPQILLGRIDLVLAGSVSALIVWLLFYFVWIGVHWVRWLIGGFMGLVAFANLIWGTRDGNALRMIDGSIGLPVAGYLGLAPSVYFFALRQKEVVRWKESLVVAAVFALLLLSVGAGILALYGCKAHLENRAFADKAFRRVFVDGDTNFLRSHATERLMQEEGWEKLSRFMAGRYMAIGVVRDVRPARGNAFGYAFPARSFPKVE